MTTTGIILAGGKSSRMGKNKALLSVDGKKIIELIAAILKRIFKDVIIISNSKEDFKFLGLQIFEDIYPGLGPLAGIHSGLINSSSEKNFIISCDLPLITEEVIKYISEFKSDKTAIIFKKDEQYQYLCGIYMKALIPALGNALTEKRLKMYSFIKEIDAEIVDASIFPEEVFFNLNTPEDYLFLKKNFNN